VADGGRVEVGVGVRVAVGDGCADRATRLPWAGIGVGVINSGICTRPDILACAAAASCLTCWTGSLPSPSRLQTLRAAPAESIAPSEDRQASGCGHSAGRRSSQPMHGHRSGRNGCRASAGAGAPHIRDRLPFLLEARAAAITEHRVNPYGMIDGMCR